MDLIALFTTEKFELRKGNCTTSKPIRNGVMKNQLDLGRDRGRGGQTADPLHLRLVGVDRQRIPWVPMDPSRSTNDYGNRRGEGVVC